MLYKLLKTDLPAIVTRTAEVFGVIVALTNGIDHMESNEVKDVLLKAVMPLLIDNNIRTSEGLQRYAFELSGIKIDETTTPKGEAVNASAHELPLFRAQFAKLTTGEETRGSHCQSRQTRNFFLIHLTSIFDEEEDSTRGRRQRNNHRQVGAQ